MLFHSVWQNRSMRLHQGYVLFCILLSCLVILALIIVYRTYEATLEPIDDDRWNNGWGTLDYTNLGLERSERHLTDLENTFTVV